MLVLKYIFLRYTHTQKFLSSEIVHISFHLRLYWCGIFHKLYNSFQKRVWFYFTFFFLFHKVRFIILGQLDKLWDSVLNVWVMYVLFCFNVLHLLYSFVLNQVAVLLLKIKWKQSSQRTIVKEYTYHFFLLGGLTRACFYRSVYEWQAAQFRFM